MILKQRLMPGGRTRCEMNHQVRPVITYQRLDKIKRCHIALLPVTAAGNPEDLCAPLSTGSSQVMSILAVGAENQDFHRHAGFTALTTSIVGNGKMKEVPCAKVSCSRSMNSCLKCQGSTR